VRIVIADDTLLVREGIASLLRGAGFEGVAEAASGGRAARARGHPRAGAGARRHPDASHPARGGSALDLVAEGLSNKEIADRLVITEGAVQKHVTSIFTRLELPAGDDAHRRILAVLKHLSASRGGETIGS
jgi:DNA-binding NarL/FixJ family response regulator